jgi:hypothetical protein
MPAGVVVYFVVSSMVRIGQQAVVTRLEFPELRTGESNGTKPTKPPKPVKPAPQATVVQEKAPKPVAPSPRVAQGQQRNSSRNRKRKRK